MSKLSDALAAGEFVITAELGPGREPVSEQVRATARSFAPLVHAANVTDNQAATVKLSPLACSVWMLQEGLEPIMQLAARDRNLLALQADLLGAWALGVRSVLALSGDPLKIGPYEELASPSGVDSMALLEAVARMNDGKLAAGEALEQPTAFLAVTAANPLVDSVERLAKKVEAGARCIQTNIVYDVERFLAWLEPIVDAGLTAQAPLLVGVTPPRSTRMLRHMHDNIPGVEVDDETFARMEGLEGEEARAMGVEIAVDVIAGVRRADAIAGVHIMAPGWEAEAVPRVVAGAGLAAST